MVSHVQVRNTVHEAKAALEHSQIAGNMQKGCGGSGLCSGRPQWNKTGPGGRRKQIVVQIQRQEEVVRCTKAVVEAQQQQWLNWENVEKKKLSRNDLWGMEDRRVWILLGATYLTQWEWAIAQTAPLFLLCPPCLLFNILPQTLMQCFRWKGLAKSHVVG